MNNIVLLYSDISKGMKSYGPKAIVPIDRYHNTLITKQIDTIQKNYRNTKYKIYVVLGFDKDKVIDILASNAKYSNVTIIDHKQYIKDNQGSGFIEAINLIHEGNMLVIQNGIFANYIPKTPQHNIIPILKKRQNGAFPIGVRSVDSRAQYLFYDLDYDWSEICFFSDNDYLSIRNFLMNSTSMQQKNSMFLFEHINNLIDNNYIFNTEIISLKNIKKVINHKIIC
jgi:hypothetical protein